jgi:hypothetical protein
MGEVIGFPQRDRRAEPEPLWREAVGRELRTERQAQERTLADVAQDAGVSTQYLSEVERGRKEPSSPEDVHVVGHATLDDLRPVFPGY